MQRFVVYHFFRYNIISILFQPPVVRLFSSYKISRMFSILLRCSVPVEMM